MARKRRIAGMVLSAGFAAPSIAQIGPVTMVPAGRWPVIERPVLVCFAPGTDPIYAARITAMVNQMNAARFGADYVIGGSWGPQGVPHALTWSFAPDGLDIPGLAGEPDSPSSLFATMDAAFAQQGGRATWVNRFQQVFNRWQALSGLSYARVRFGGNDWDDGQPWNTVGAAGLRGDIRISMHPIDGAYLILAYCQLPENGDMVLDADDAPNFASAGGGHLFLRNTVAHEHGHGIGLLHVCPADQTKLMEPILSLSHDGPRQDDIRGAQYLYGDPGGLDDSPQTAHSLGPLQGAISYGAAPPPVSGAGDPSSSIASIDNSGKTDWYSFTVSGPGVANVTATPVGSVYISGPQDPNCDSGSSFDYRAVANLGVEVYAGDGTTVLGSSNIAPIGQPEVLSGVALIQSGTYFIRIFTTTHTPDQSQLYTLSVANPCPSFTQQPIGGTVRVGTPFTLSAAATGDPAPFLQWRRNMQPIPGATLGTYTVAAAQYSDAGTYDCVAFNSCGAIVSDSAVVAVTCYANCDLSTSPPTLNINDFQCFLNRFAAGDPTANCDGSTVPPILNVNDFQCFVNLFAAGCS